MPPSFSDRLRHYAREAWRLLRRQDIALLVLLVVLAGGAWGLAELGEAVTEGGTQTVDERILLALRNPADLTDPIGSGEVEEAVRDMTALGGLLVTTLLTLGLAGFFLLDRRPRLALFVVAAVVGGVLVSSALKLGFDRPRPELVPHGSHVVTPSFPSGHSSTATVVYLTLGVILARALPRRRMKVYVVALAVLVALGVGFSRVYLGVHWPTDVLAGWTVGGLWALACWLAERALQRRGLIERVVVLRRSRPPAASDVEARPPSGAGASPRSASEAGPA